MKRLRCAAWAFGMALLLPAAALAADQQSFVSTSQLPNGEIVSLSANPQVVEPATSHNSESMVGVVAPQEVNPFTATNDAQQVSVTTNGVANTLVSNVNGDIKVGDYIVVSPIVGVGAKTTASGRVLGVAQASFDAKTAGATQVTVTDTTGHKHSVAVGSIPVLINITYYMAPPTKVVQQTLLPSFLQRLANTVAGKQVSPLPLIISFVLVAAALIIAGMLINSAIRSSIIAVGRNPLSRSILQRSMVQIVLLAAAVIGGGLVGALAILRLL